MRTPLTKFRRRFAIIRQIQSADYWLLVRLGCFAASVPFLMRLKLAHAARLLTVKPPPIAPDPAQVQRLIRCVDLLLRVGPPLIQARCLTRGVTLYYFLRRAGMPVALHFGVATAVQPFQAHCWLVYEGTPYAEAEDTEQSFTSVYVMGDEH